MSFRRKTTDWAKELGFPGANDSNFADFDAKLYNFYEWQDILKGVLKREDAKRIKSELLLYKIRSTSNPIITKRPDCIKTYETLVDIEKAKEKSSLLDIELEKIQTRITQLQNGIKTKIEENERAENQKVLNLKNSKLLHWMNTNIMKCVTDLSNTTENLNKIKKKNFIKRVPNYLLENEVQEILKKLTKGNELSELNVLLGEKIYDTKKFHFELKSDSSLKLMFAFNRRIEKMASEMSSLQESFKEKRKMLESSIEQKSQNDPSVHWLRFYLIIKTKLIEYNHKMNYKNLLEELLKKDASDEKLMKYSKLKAEISFFTNEMSNIKENIRFCSKVNLKNLSKFTDLIREIVSQVSKSGFDHDISTFVESLKNSSQIEFEQVAPNVVGTSSILVYDDIVEKADYVRMLKEFKFPEIRVSDLVNQQEEPQLEDIKKKLNSLNNTFKELKRMNEMNYALLEKL